MALTDYRSLYDKDFIGAWDLQEGDLTVTIKKVKGGELTSVGGRKSKKPVVFMAHTEKGFALNATNGKTIASLYGNYTEKWTGKQITLYKSMTRSPDGSGDVECIRVRPSIPEGGGFEPKQKVTPAQIEEVHAALSENGVSIEAVLAKAAVKELTELDAADLPGALAWIRKQKKSAGSA